MKIQQHEKEIDIENAIMEYLQRKSYLVLKLKRTGIYDPTKKIFRLDKNPLHKDSEGMADLLLFVTGYDRNYMTPTFSVKHPIPVFLEVKTKIGKQSTEQKKFQKRVTAENCGYYIVRSIEDVEKILEELLK